MSLSKTQLIIVKMSLHNLKIVDWDVKVSTQHSIVIDG